MGAKLPTAAETVSTFFMNKLSCLEHLSTLSLSTEMSEIMLQRKKAQVTQNQTTRHNKQIHNVPTRTAAHLMLVNLGLLSCLSMRLRRICSTSSRSSGSSVREKDNSGSRKELGNAVSMFVVWKPAVT